MSKRSERIDHVLNEYKKAYYEVNMSFEKNDLSPTLAGYFNDHILKTHLNLFSEDVFGKEHKRILEAKAEHFLIVYCKLRGKLSEEKAYEVSKRIIFEGDCEEDEYKEDDNSEEDEPDKNFKRIGGIQKKKINSAHIQEKKNNMK